MSSPRNPDLEAMTFWLMLNAVIIGITSFPIKDAIAASGIVFAGLYVIVGYFAWKGKRWTSILAIVFALVTLLGTFLLDFSSTAGGSVFLFFSQQAYLFIPEYLLIFYAFRALNRKMAN